MRYNKRLHTSVILMSSIAALGLLLMETQSSARERDPLPPPVVAPVVSTPPVTSINQQAGFQSGGLNTNTTSGGIDSMFNQTLIDGGVTSGQGDGPEAGAQSIRVSSSDEKWMLFTTFNYGNLDVEGNSGVQTQTYAAAVGALYRINPMFRVGASVGNVHSTGVFANEAGRLESDGVTMAAYGIANFGDTFVDLIYAATLENNDFSRESTLSNATASANSVTHAISSTVGHNFRFGRFVTGPRIGLDFAHWSMEGYTENGTGTLLSVAEQRANSLITRIDWFASYDIKVRAGTITPYGLAGWHRETLGGQPTLGAGIVGTGVNPTISTGPDRVRHYLVASAGVTWNLVNAWKINAGYVGQFFGGAYQVHTASAMIAWSF